MRSPLSSSSPTPPPTPTNHAHAHRYGKKRIERDEEPTVSIADRLAKILDDKIRAQQFFKVIEFMDVGTDTFSGVVKLLNYGDTPLLLLIGFTALAVVVVPLGIYGLVQRGKVMASYRRILDGTEANLVAHASALDSSNPSVDEKSVRIRCVRAASRVNGEQPV